MATLTQKQRDKMPSSEFALSGGRYPLDTENRARDALSRVSQFGTAQEKATVHAAVKRKFPQIHQQQQQDNKISATMNNLIRGAH